MRPQKLTHFFLLISIIGLNLFLHTGCSSLNLTTSKANCIEDRATLDIGSGSTKILAAKVDLCEKKILQVYLNSWESLKFKESLQSNNGQISKKLITSAQIKINQWQEQLKKWNITSYKAVATEVFRQAQNGEEVLQQISQSTQIPITLIDQKQEALLGFWSAIAALNLNPEEVMVWDIGGGSMQIINMLTQDQTQIYMGKMASVSFKDEIVKLKKGSQNKQSPNPLGLSLANKAIDQAFNYALKDLPPDLRQKAKDKKVIGIGGVHSKSILKQAQAENSYFRKDLKSVLTKRAQLNDSMIGGPYPETEVTNIALVLGFMQALNIEEVQVADANLTHGLILQR